MAREVERSAAAFAANDEQQEVAPWSNGFQADEAHLTEFLSMKRKQR